METVNSTFDVHKEDGSELTEDEVITSNQFANSIIAAVKDHGVYNGGSGWEVLVTAFWFVKYAYVKEYASQGMRAAIKTAVTIYRSRGKNAAIAYCTLIGIHFNGMKSYEYDDVFKVNQLCGNALDIIKMLERLATVTDQSLESLFTRAIESQIGKTIEVVELEFYGNEDNQRMTMAIQLQK
jgi:hypothetical protein